MVENFFEAAIVFGRSVLDHLGKEYGDRPGGRAWHRVKTDALIADPELGDFVRFLHDNRDVILHEAPSQHERRFVVGGAHFVTTARSPDEDWQLSQVQGGMVPVFVEIAFTSLPGKYVGLSAFALVGQYLHRLDKLVAEAEERFR